MDQKEKWTRPKGEHTQELRWEEVGFLGLERMPVGLEHREMDGQKNGQDGPGGEGRG